MISMIWVGDLAEFRAREVLSSTVWSGRRSAFAQFVLRLELEVLEWVRGKQPKLLDQQRLREARDLETIDPASDAVAACRVMAEGRAVTATISCVADAAPGTAEELLTVLWRKGLFSVDYWKGLVDSAGRLLQTGQKVRKRRKTSEKAAASEEAGSEAKPFTDALEELRDPVTNLLDIFEFLSQNKMLKLLPSAGTGLQRDDLAAECPAAMPAREKRIDPEDGVAYTYEELEQYYKGRYTKQEIAAYWEECEVFTVPSLGTFKIDGEIAAPRGAGRHRELVAWNSGEEDRAGVSLTLESESSRLGVEAWNQFEYNEKHFGITASTYREELYTTALNVDEIPEWMRNEAEAVARAIENGQSYGRKEEAVNDDMDEEEEFSTVGSSQVREPVFHRPLTMENLSHHAAASGLARPHM
ncbi:Atxn2, partial [Symbiodinium sp. KB8]